MRDSSTIVNGIITKREWRYWSSASGWVKIPGQGDNVTSITVDSNNLSNVNINKLGFQLLATTDTNMTGYDAHDVASINSDATIIVHHETSGGTTLSPDVKIGTAVDKPTMVYSKAIAGYLPTKTTDSVTVPASDPDKTVEYTFIYNASASAGTIIVHHKDTSGNQVTADDTFGVPLDTPTVVYSHAIANYTASLASYTVTVPTSDIDKTVEYTFIYAYSPSTLPPNVWINSNDTVIMGNDIDIDGTGTDPQNNPISYSWEVNPSSWMQGTLSGTSSTVWFNQVGNVNVTLTGTTSGGSDTDTKQIRVLPPTPQVILVSPLSIRTNHKLTISALSSTSGSQRYTLDWPKSIWEISITDSSQGLTLNDIKTLLPYSLAINVQGKQVIRIVGDYKQIEILSKKQGKINVYSQLTNTANYTGFASREIEILPDLPPIIGVSVTKETLRDPEDANLAPIDLIDTSTSPDGDTIGKRVWFYAFDSDNDSLFTDEIWYVLDNNVWQPVTNYGISGSYLSLKDINIDLVNDGNKQMVLFKSNSVGVRMFGLIIRENLNNVNSIPVFITPSDMQKSSTFE